MILSANQALRAPWLQQYTDVALAGDIPQPLRINLLQLLNTASDSRVPGAILPRRDGARTEYYAVADSTAVWRELRPLLLAFAGPTFSTFDGLPTPLRPDDPIDHILERRGFAAVSRFGTFAAARDEEVLLNALLRLQDGLARREAAPRSLPRPTTEVVRQFDLALAANDRSAAAEALAYLRDNLRMDERNLQFMQVRADAAFGDWQVLRSRPFFTALCGSRRPAVVSSDLVRAVYEVTVRPAAASGSPQIAVQRFRERDLEAARPLFATLPVSPRPAVATMFLVAHLADRPEQPVDLGLREAARATANASADEEEVALLLAMLALAEEASASATVPADGAARPIAYLSALGRVADQAVSPTASGARAVLLAAMETQSIDAYREALAYSDRLSAAEREALLSSPAFRAILEEITAKSAGGQLPHNWIEWMAALPQLDFGQARDLAVQAATEWPIARHLRTNDDVRSLTEALMGVPTGLEQRVIDVLPHLTDWVRRDPAWPNPAYIELYRTLLELFVLGSNRSALVLGVAASLVDGILSIGLAADDYRQVLGDLRGALPSAASVRSADWVLDLVEITVEHPCPDSAAREQLWLSADGVLAPLAQRLEPVQRMVAQELGNILGVPSNSALSDTKEAEVTAPGISLEGFLLAIYTLTEGVGERVGRALTALHPGLRVEVSHAATSTQRLQDLARSADLFAVCWRSAKHAATNAIQRARPASRPTIFPLGKGSSSLLREVQEALSVHHGVTAVR